MIERSVTAGRRFQSSRLWNSFSGSRLIGGWEVIRTFGLMLCIVFAGMVHTQALAQDRSPAGQAHWLLERLTGVKWPMNNSVEVQMANKIASGDSIGAADLATSQAQFLNITVKQMALKLSTREETVRLTLNDFTAAFMGVTRDQSDARELLYGNFYYAADPTRLPAGVTVGMGVKDFLATNNHYDQLDKTGLDVGSLLVRTEGQRIMTDDAGDGVAVANPDPAGVLTLHTWMAAHAVAGTNRRLVEYTFREFMCIPLINWADTQAPDVRVGRDIDRFPGGDNAKYQTTCKGCHTQQDGFRGAFAKWDFNSGSGIATYGGSGGQNGARPSADGNGVMNKMNANNTVYPGGYVTTDDSWVNHAIRAGGTNVTLFGFRGLAPTGAGAITGGRGVNSFGRLVANSKRFSQCMARHVFESVCKRDDLKESEAESLYASFGMSFEQNQYNLKKLFQTVAVHPKCRM